jgi:hypothetical protein
LSVRILVRQQLDCQPLEPLKDLLILWVLHVRLSLVLLPMSADALKHKPDQGHSIFVRSENCAVLIFIASRVVQQHH